MNQHHTNIKPGDWTFRYFSPIEIACRGSGMVMLNAESRAALTKLDRLRELCGHPLILNSAYRSPAHNKRVGGAKNSLHMRGNAFDVRMDNVDPHRFERLARDAGFTGFGHYVKQGFMHIDTGPARSWGKPFPARVNRFAPEPRRPTASTDLAATVPASVATGAAIEAGLRELAPHVAPDWQGYILSAAAVLGLGLAVWRIVARARQPNGVSE